MKIKKVAGRKYFTEAMARALKPGDRLNLRYDDFNQGEFQFVFEKLEERTTGPCPVRILGYAWYPGDEEPLEMEFYCYDHHRDGSKASVVCRGSGAERLFLI